MTSPSVSVDVSDHVATVTIDRPPVNAVDAAALVEIRQAFESLNDRRDVRAAIFTGAGSRAFIGGVDLKAVDDATAIDSPSLVIDRWRVAREAMWAIYDCAVPVIVAVNGPAMGAGLALAAVGDIILAAESATFAVPEINVGLLGGSSQMSLLVGRHKARELFFLGERISAQELHRLGAIRAVVPDAGLLEAARDLAGTLAEKSPIALRLAKESMNRVEFLPLKDAYRIEQDYSQKMRRFEDSKEARQAFFENRPPDWKWR